MKEERWVQRIKGIYPHRVSASPPVRPMVSGGWRLGSRRSFFFSGPAEPQLQMPLGSAHASKFRAQQAHEFFARQRKLNRYADHRNPPPSGFPLELRAGGPPERDGPWMMVGGVHGRVFRLGFPPGPDGF